MLHTSVLLVLVVSVLGSGCATIASGPMQTVQIDSNPQGANVYTAVKNSRGRVLNRKEAGVTPTSVSITRKDGAVLLEKPGYHPAEVPLNRGVNPWIIGDILLTSLLSTLIDASTGAINQYDPDQYLVELHPEEPDAAVPVPQEPAATSPAAAPGSAEPAAPSPDTPAP
ncbi:MAG TPA: PEGA domain-containing protein [Candidatus Binatia bacterium]|nr:PEGA domain-containing protein [Candidatus Binatia bacterium]